jgi:hypothetical protein
MLLPPFVGAINHRFKIDKRMCGVGITFARREVCRGGIKELDMMRFSFSTMTAARAAVNVLEAYGYSAKQFDCDVVTDCPTLLAIPAIQKRIGFAEIERLDLNGGKLFAETTAEFFAPPPAARPDQSSGLTA